MADTTKVRIGLEGARELEFDVDDADEIRNAVAAAIESSEPVLWVRDAKGTEYGLITAKIAFLEIEGTDTSSGVGFTVAAGGAGSG